ncbi:MAG: dienelactone hydrolase family protein [Actinomycetota bacterium]|nr:dienelactone hydrolase family protein [Actinomycetota bacterium]
MARPGEVTIALGEIVLGGILTVPEDPQGVVLFAHGSGSGRHSPRNRLVADALVAQGFATLLFDLLTADEERADAVSGHLRFDIDLLASRLLGATEWLRSGEVAALPIGYFGASTGAGAALVAAARLGGAVGAVVSRGGRPDLAGKTVLGRVSAPTLLIVGGLDATVLELNERALERLGGVKRLEVVSGASHLFEEPGALDEVARLAAAWFWEHIRKEG